jgi:hypothetical protein
MPENGSRHSLLLGIHGPSGDGKTFQCEEILSRMGVRTFLISGGQWESSDAGAPAQFIRKTYLDAGTYMSGPNAYQRAAALLLNDVDTGLGDWGPLNQTTVNRQTTFGELMHLADYPRTVENRETARVPIIITGNDLSKLYAPLTRSGRMRSFEWRPTFEERTRIVSELFDASPSFDSASLVRQFSDQPIAFFAEVLSTVSDDSLWRSLPSKLSEIVPFIRNHLFESRSLPGFQEVIRVANDLAKASTLRDHLRKDSTWQ